MIADKETLKIRLDELNAEIEGLNDEILVLRDKVTELAKERGRVTDMIADMADEEGQNP